MASSSVWNSISVFLTLPSGLKPEDVKDQPLIMYPGAIQTTYQNAYKIGGGKNARTRVLAVFNKDDIWVLNEFEKIITNNTIIIIVNRGITNCEDNETKNLFPTLLNKMKIKGSKTE